MIDDDKYTLIEACRSIGLAERLELSLRGEEYNTNHLLHK